MKRLSRANNSNQLVLGFAPLTSQEKDIDDTALILGMNLANIANKIYKLKSKICNYKDLKSKDLLYKDLIFYKKAFETIAKI